MGRNCLSEETTLRGERGKRSGAYFYFLLLKILDLIYFDTASLLWINRKWPFCKKIYLLNLILVGSLFSVSPSPFPFFFLSPFSPFPLNTPLNVTLQQTEITTNFFSSTSCLCQFCFCFSSFPVTESNISDFYVSCGS